MAIKNILLLGGSGFVGSHIANLLATREGIRITVPSRRRERAKHLLPLPGVDVVEANINDEAQLAELMRGQDAVINLVGILHGDSALPYGKKFAQAHVELPRNIVAAMQKAGVKRLVHMSALKADAKGCSEYLRSKGDGEAIVLAAQGVLDVTVFRPSVIFGVGDSFLNTFAKVLKLAPVFPIGFPDARFQPVWVDDVANAFVDVVEKSETFGQAYELCGPGVFSLRELVQYVGKVTGNPRSIFKLSEGWAYLQAGLLWLAPKPMMSPDNLRSMQIDNVATSGAKIPANWSPASLEAVAPTYLAADPNAKFNTYRGQAGR
jgi:NADH dehydrogenase